jgi:hypothetical protein
VTELGRAALKELSRVVKKFDGTTPANAWRVASPWVETDSRDQFLDGVLYDHKLDNVEVEVARARGHGYDEPDAPAHIGPILESLVNASLVFTTIAKREILTGSFTTGG